MSTTNTGNIILKKGKELNLEDNFYNAKQIFRVVIFQSQIIFVIQLPDRCITYKETNSKLE